MVRKRTGWTVIFIICIAALFAGQEATAATKPGYVRTMEKYEVPDVTLINQDGAKVRIKDLLLSDKPVLVDFIYTTCTTICPVLSANFTNFQRQGEAKTGPYRLISISVDPQNDTPKAMKSYLSRYQAKPGWDFLTGSQSDIDKVLIAMNAKTPNKMDHYPLILIKSPSQGSWVRINGLIGTAPLMKEFKEVVK
jgi:protein SCO1/2